MMNHNAQCEKTYDKNSKKENPGEVETARVEEVSAGIKAESESGLHHGADGARETLHTVHTRVKKAVDDAEVQAREVVSDVKERLAPVDQWVRTTTSEHPYLIIGTTIGASFLAGFLMRRRAAVGAGVALGFLTGCYLNSRSPGPTRSDAKPARRGPAQPTHGSEGQPAGPGPRGAVSRWHKGCI